MKYRYTTVKIQWLPKLLKLIKQNTVSKRQIYRNTARKTPQYRNNENPNVPFSKRYSLTYVHFVQFDITVNKIVVQMIIYNFDGSTKYIVPPGSVNRRMNECAINWFVKLWVVLMGGFTDNDKVRDINFTFYWWCLPNR